MLALIVGRGKLPAKVIGALSERPLVCALEGHVPDSVQVDMTFRLETFGTLLLELGGRGVTDVCLCGAIERPTIDPAKLDEETKPLVPLFMEALSKGDDGALRIVMQVFEQTGFKIRAAHELIPKVVVEAGVLSARAPRSAHDADARVGKDIVAEMGKADLGQACVIRKGHVLAREDEAGTDAMLGTLAMTHMARPDAPVEEWALDDAGELTEAGRDWLRVMADENHKAPGAGGILFKAPKPEQDRRADLPVIGPVTVLNAAEAGLDGIALEAGGVIVIDPKVVLEIIDTMNMVLWGRV
ncbi:UDP-2,3-diacylglucosamine diphosphatase LpxI [Rhodobacteraceae bacterium D3-12]|nr:UDP-2,3-diacylglucosamine diphosphatase LpxI [Rhodobacteraceae bacterium D3-12]